MFYVLWENILTKISPNQLKANVVSSWWLTGFARGCDDTLSSIKWLRGRPNLFQTALVTSVTATHSNLMEFSCSCRIHERPDDSTGELLQHSAVNLTTS